MASITIRNLGDDVKIRLRVRAAGNGRSVQEEARLILREAVGRDGYNSGSYPSPTSLKYLIYDPILPSSRQIHCQYCMVLLSH